MGQVVDCLVYTFYNILNFKPSKTNERKWLSKLELLVVNAIFFKPLIMKNFKHSPK